MRSAELGAVVLASRPRPRPRPRRFMAGEQVRTEHETSHEPPTASVSPLGESVPEGQCVWVRSSALVIYLSLRRAAASASRAG